MELEVYWTDFSKKELKNIFDFYKENTSLHIAKRLVVGITKEINYIPNNSFCLSFSHLMKFHPL
jgi:hypothetical protein